MNEIEIGYFLIIGFGYANAAVFDSTGKRLAYIECKSRGKLNTEILFQFGDICEIVDKMGRITFTGSESNFTCQKRKWDIMVNKANQMKHKTETHKFKKGQTLQLDEIYTIQGLADGNWWTADDPSIKGGSGGEVVTIAEGITIKITVTRNK